MFQQTPNFFNMKKAYTLILFTIIYIFLSPQNSQAQITVTTEDMPVIGTTKTVATKSGQLNIDLGTDSNVPQVWDFTSLGNGDGNNEVKFLDPNGLPGFSSFSSSTMARTGDIAALFGFSLPFPFPLPPSTVYYSKDAAGKVYIDGFNTSQVPIIGELNLPANPKFLIYAPGQYGDNFSATSTAFEYDVNTDTLGTIGLKIKLTKSYEIDAHGTLKLPDGEYSVLRYNELVTINLQIGTYIPIINIFVPLIDSSSSSRSVRFWAKDEQYPVATVNYVNIGGTETPVNIEYLDQPSIQVEAKFGLQKNCLSIVTNNSSNNAETYSWNFGDGATSTLPNPVHTYTQPGNYTVTLTATASDGTTDQFTQNVSVDYCQAVSNNALKNNGLKFYPNPANQLLYIQNIGLNTPSKVQIFDTMGKKVLEQAITQNNTTLSVTELATGMYIAVVQTKAGAFTQKISVIK